MKFKGLSQQVLSVSLSGVATVALAVQTPPPAVRIVTPPTTAMNTKAPQTAEPAYMSYKYEGDRYRDPFIPLTGSGADAGNDRAPQISSLSLKGIVQDEKGRIAVMGSGASSYILRAGRLYDGRNKPVKGISGVIKAQSVVLVGPDRAVKEFVLDKSAL